MKIGDRVRLTENFLTRRRWSVNTPLFIVEPEPNKLLNANIFLIFGEDVFYISDGLSEYSSKQWMPKRYLQLDIEHYRDEKLNKLGI